MLLANLATLALVKMPAVAMFLLQEGATVGWDPVALWRHLWSGSTEPFRGRFHQFEDFSFGPLPAQGDRLRIVIGGRAKPAVERAGRIADGYHSSTTSPTKYAERVPILRAAAESAGRAMP